MYEALFGLHKNPFAMTPDPGLLYLTLGHREALAGLCYAVTGRKGFAVLTGETGTGKTTLLQRLLSVTRSTENPQTSVILNPTLTPSEFLELALMDFGFNDIPASKAQRLAMLARFLAGLHQERRAAVLIIDEAHKLSPEVLEEVRLLTNLETADHKLLQIILAGQSELTEVLNREDLRQLKQRIAVRLSIGALRESEVGQYMAYRWVKCGSHQRLPFSQEAIGLVARWSRGLPRLINAICDNALVLAYAGDVATIGPEQILEVVRDLDLEKPEGAKGAMAAAQRPVSAPIAVERQRAAPGAHLESTTTVQAPVLAMLERYARPREKRWLFRWAAKLGLRRAA